METYIWATIGSGNGLLPDGTKPSPVTSHNELKIFFLKKAGIFPGAIKQAEIIFVRFNIVKVKQELVNGIHKTCQAST